MTETEVKKFSMEEVRKHVESKDPWIVINDSVYNVTEFLADVCFFFGQHVIF